MDLMERFSTPDKARKHLESIRWSDGVVCPHCGNVDDSCELKPMTGTKTHARKGVYKCRGCRKQFTVTVGTIFEGSHIPLNKWLIAMHLLCASKKGISTHQLHRMLGITYKCAWHMTHRIRYAMKQPPLAQKLYGTVEVDETYVGGKEKGIGRGPHPYASKKIPVVALVERHGNVRTFPVDRVTLNNIAPILKAHVHEHADLNTDDSSIYQSTQADFPYHRTVVHSRGEYVRREGLRKIHTNTVEGFFSLVKRSVYGTYHHWSPQHLHRYLAEIEFRYNFRKTNDGDRTVAALLQTEGKRLTYKPLAKGE